MFLFELVKWLGALLQPLPILTFIILLGFVLHLRGQAKLAKFLQGLSLAFLLLMATPPLSGILIKNIEQDIPAFDENQRVDFIVVLGCSHYNSPERSITSQLAPCSLYRTTEGVRLFNLNPNATLIFSGYGGIQHMSNAQTNKELAIALGVPASQIRIEPRAKNTMEEAQLLAETLQNQTFALVTSASHMPRALQFFSKEGLAPIPAPTGHLYVEPEFIQSRSYLPNTNNLGNTGVALYEALGRLWQYLIS